MQAISTVLSQLYNLLKKLCNPLYQCLSADSFECGSIFYGALFKEMELQGLLLIPAVPYHDLSVSELYTKMRRIRSPACCRPGKSKKSQHSCNLSESVIVIADPVIRLAKSPKLENFKSFNLL